MYRESKSSDLIYFPKSRPIFQRSRESEMLNFGWFGSRIQMMSRLQTLGHGIFPLIIPEGVGPSVWSERRNKTDGNEKVPSAAPMTIFQWSGVLVSHHLFIHFDPLPTSLHLRRVFEGLMESRDFPRNGDASHVTSSCGYTGLRKVYFLISRTSLYSQKERANYDVDEARW